MKIPALLFSLGAPSPLAVAAPEVFEVGPDQKSARRDISGVPSGARSFCDVIRWCSLVPRSTTG